jgi:hypothetical protein
MDHLPATSLDPVKTGPTHKIMGVRWHYKVFPPYQGLFAQVSKFQIDFEKNNGELIKTTPHIAFEVDDLDKELHENDFEIFKRALCFDAKNDFFDLKTVIKDQCISFNANFNPIIEINDINDLLKKAILHKMIFL